MAQSTEIISVGIDLGTTNSCVAVVKNENVIIIQDDYGNRTMPSMFTHIDDNKTLVGWEAYDQFHMYPQSTVYETKRLIGQNFDNKEVQKFKNQCTYKIINDDNMIQIRLNDTDFYPEEIASRVLLRLKEVAEKYTGKKVANAVIAVPAYFGDTQRDATKSAAYLAGFGNVFTINEPTAAALAFQHNNPKNEKRIILIYDFGGGTFDVTVAAVEKRNCFILATKGDCFLGGTDIDTNLADYIKTKLNEQSTVTHRRLKTIAEEVKKKLSSRPFYEIDSLCDKSITIKRKDFEDVSMRLFSKTIDIARECVEDAGLNPKDIDEIVPIGGSTRIRKVLEMLKQTFKSSNIAATINPDEAVAYGAAIYATHKFENNQEINVKDVLSLSLGVEQELGHMRVIFRRNTRIPCEHTEDFTSTTPTFTIKLYQGESLFVVNNHYLGQCSINDVHMKSIRIKYSFDEDGLLTILAQSSTQIELKIDMTKHKLDEKEISQLVSYENNTEEELKYFDFIKKKNQFDFYCEKLRQQLQNHHRHKKIMERIYDFKKKVAKFSPVDIRKIDTFMDDLNNMYNKPKATKRFLKRFGI